MVEYKPALGVEAISAQYNNAPKAEFKRVPDVAQYGGSDYSNAVRVERGISLEKAKESAANDPNIDYFVYLKGWSMVLCVPEDFPTDPEKDPLHLITTSPFIYDSGERGFGRIRVFHHGDVVFFKNEGKWLGSAPGLADVYEKV